jgi:hypothetical protein
VSGGIEAEMRQALANIRAVLEGHRSSMDRVIKSTAISPTWVRGGNEPRRNLTLRRAQVDAGRRFRAADRGVDSEPWPPAPSGEQEPSGSRIASTAALLGPRSAMTALRIARPFGPKE